MNFRIPGPVCLLVNVPLWDDGTLALVPGNAPVSLTAEIAGEEDHDFDAERAAKFARNKAQKQSVGRCARYVMAAIARGFDAVDDDTDPSTLSASLAVTKIEAKLGKSAPVVVPVSAKSYGPVLVHLGFQQMKEVAAKSTAKEDFAFAVGDVVVIQATSTSSHGHIQLYYGTQWISDFVQKDPLWPHTSATSEWQVEKPGYVVYRSPTN